MGEWISVKERLPDFDVDVLAWTGFSCIVCSLETLINGIASWEPPEGLEATYDMASVVVDCNVTHWMPLPEPPCNE